MIDRSVQTDIVRRQFGRSGNYGVFHGGDLPFHLNFESIATRSGCSELELRQFGPGARDLLLQVAVLDSRA